MSAPFNPLHRLLLEDNSSFLLLEDNTSKLILDEQTALDDPLNAGTVSTVTPALTFIGESLSGSPVQAIPLSTKMGNAQQTSYTTASISPAPNNLILLWVYSIAASTPNTPTATGNGLTWVQVATVGDGSGLRTLTLFRAMGTAPTAGAITIDFSAQTQQGAGWSIVQYNNVNTSGTNGSGAIVQNITGNTAGASTGSLSLTLANFVSTMNATAGGFGIPLNTAALPAVGGSFVATGQDNQSSTNTAIGSEFLSTNSTTVSMSSPGASIPWAGIAVEISAKPALTYEVEVDTVNTFDSTVIGTSSSVTTYYFNGHTSITDPNAVWTNAANAFDGSTSTSATSATAGSTSADYLYGKGTTAPLNSNSITQVRGRIFGSGIGGATGINTSAELYTASLADDLGGVSSGTGTGQFGSYVVLTTPSGGWSWTKLQNLETKIYNNTTGAGGTVSAFRVEIEVTYSVDVLGPLLDNTSDLNIGFADDTTTSLGDDRLLLEDNASYLLLEDNSSKLAINYDYPSNDYLTYTVPAATLISGNTYYWRVRQKVQNGGSYTSWSEIRSFTVSTGTLHTSSLSGSFSTSGLIPARLVTRNLTASYSDNGAITLRAIARNFTATLSSSATLAKKLARSLSGTFSTSGVLASLHQHFSSLTGTFSASGLITARTISRALSGTFRADGNLTRAITRLLTATLSVSGSVARSTIRSLNGSFSSNGSLTKLSKLPLSGTFSATGLITNRAITRSLTGTFSATASLIRAITRNLSGTFSASGGLTKLFNRLLSGTYSDSGSITRRLARTFNGTFSASGALTRAVARTLSASFSATGALAKTTARALTGLFSTIGALTTQLNHGGTAFTQSLSATFSASGAITTRAISRQLTATFSSSGTLTRAITRSLSATFMVSTSFIRQAARSLTGTFSDAGTLVKTTGKSLSGGYSDAGLITGRAITRNLIATYQTAGSFAKRAAINFSAAMSFAGALISSKGHPTVSTLPAVIFLADGHIAVNIGGNVYLPL